MICSSQSFQFLCLPKFNVKLVNFKHILSTQTYNNCTNTLCDIRLKNSSPAFPRLGFSNDQSRLQQTDNIFYLILFEDNVWSFRPQISWWRCCTLFSPDDGTANGLMYYYVQRIITSPPPTSRHHPASWCGRSLCLGILRTCRRFSLAWYYGIKSFWFITKLVNYTTLTCKVVLPSTPPSSGSHSIQLCFMVLHY